MQPTALHARTQCTAFPPCASTICAPVVVPLWKNWGAHAIISGVVYVATLQVPELSQATAWAIACPACMTLDLAASCAPFVTTLVHGADIVPTFSSGAIDRLRDEVRGCALSSSPSPNTHIVAATAGGCFEQYKGGEEGTSYVILPYVHSERSGGFDGATPSCSRPSCVPGSTNLPHHVTARMSLLLTHFIAGHTLVVVYRVSE